MSETDKSDGYPFLDDWLRRQSEPLPESSIDWSKFRPSAKERTPKLTKETLFERKETVKSSETERRVNPESCT